MNMKIIVPWHNPEQLKKFLTAWRVSSNDDRFIFQQDEGWKSCAITKNRGIERAILEGVEEVIILDDDCFPSKELKLESFDYIDSFMRAHHKELNSLQSIPLFKQVTDPASRGTPYFNRTVDLPVAACMGFWEHVGDYDAPGQLVHGAMKPMTFDHAPVYGQYFPLCGMNLSFKPPMWWPWCQFIDVQRFDDIWQGFLWQKQANKLGYCFSLAGPIVHHSRQSDVWANLKDESLYLKDNETLWKNIFEAPDDLSYEELRDLLPL